ncbi:hypothetical protein Nepgr_001457 [Nepenthes gracilis]|uniref:Uncharacterized protein n=1 Tax=Nepenthes gracilis TaxID=150966 RepID=A0AAD3P768_NEPGR|nr:hypothetical protein Nepgr_001457 [Nepenthes gracilis]
MMGWHNGTLIRILAVTPKTLRMIKRLLGQATETMRCQQNGDDKMVSTNLYLQLLRWVLNFDTDRFRVRELFVKRPSRSLK